MIKRIVILQDEQRRSRRCRVLAAGARLCHGGHGSVATPAPPSGLWTSDDEDLWFWKTTRRRWPQHRRSVTARRCRESCVHEGRARHDRRRAPPGALEPAGARRSSSGSATRRCSTRSGVRDQPRLSGVAGSLKPLFRRSVRGAARSGSPRAVAGRHEQVRNSRAPLRSTPAGRLRCAPARQRWLRRSRPRIALSITSE